MHPRTKKAVGLTVAFTISAVCLWFFVRTVDLEEAWDAILEADHRWTALSALTIWASMVVRAFRWRVLLEDAKPVSVVRLYHMQMIGIATTGLIPGRLGEVARTIFLAAKEKLGFLVVLSSVFVERLLDLGLVIALTVAMLLAYPFPDPSTRDHLQGLGLTLGAIFAGFVVIAGMLAFAPERSVAIARGIAGKLSPALAERVALWAESFAGGLAIFRDARRTAIAKAWTFVVWTGIALSEYFLFHAFGIDAGLLGAALLTAGLALAVAVPQAPAFIGMFQLATTLVLVECFQVQQSIAGAYAILLWVVQMLFLIVLGLGSFAIEGLSLGDIRGAKAEADAQAKAESGASA